MAEDNTQNQGPVLNPDIARALEQEGLLAPETAKQIYGDTLQDAPALAPGVSQDIIAEEQIRQKQEEMQAMQAPIISSPGVGMGRSLPPEPVTQEQAEIALAEEQRAMPTQQELIQAESEQDAALIDAFNQRNAQRAQLGAAPLPPNPEVEAAQQRLTQLEQGMEVEEPQVTAADFVPTSAQNVETAQRNVAALQQESDNIYQKTIERQQDLAQKQLDQLDQLAQANQNKVDLAELDEMKRYNQRVEELAAQERKVDLAAEEYKAAEVKRPAGFFGKKGFWDQFQAALAIGLAGAAAGRGNANKALQILEKSIEDDIKEQQFKRDRLGKIADQERGLFLKLRDELGDPQAAMAATKAQIYREGQNQLQTLGQKFDIMQNSQDFQMQMNELQAREQQARQEMARRLEMDHIARNMDKYTVEDLMLAGEEGRKLAQFAVPGYKGMAPSVESAKQARQMVSVVDSVEKSVDELLAMADGKGIMGKFSPTTRATANTIQRILVGKLRLPIVGPGAVSEKELQILTDLIANPASLRTIPIQARASLKTLKRKMRDELHSQLKSEGLTVPQNQIKSFQMEN